MSDDEGEPASPSNTRRNTSDETCEYCGAAIDTSDWYPVTKERDSDGTLQFYPFCDEDCQDSWLTEESN